MKTKVVITQSIHECLYWVERNELNLEMVSNIWKVISKGLCTSYTVVGSGGDYRFMILRNDYYSYTNTLFEGEIDGHGYIGGDIVKIKGESYIIKSTYKRLNGTLECEVGKKIVEPYNYNQIIEKLKEEQQGLIEEFKGKNSTLTENDTSNITLVNVERIYDSDNILWLFLIMLIVITLGSLLIWCGISLLSN